MTTFLQLCKDAARESSTVAGDLPTTVTSQTGRLKKFVEWVKRAWLDIQNSQARWRWMRKEFNDKTLSIGTSRYTATALGISDWREWIVPMQGENIIYLYDPDIGVSDEGVVRWIEWHTFIHRYLRGSQTNNRPTEWSISPAGEICFGPPPDKAYPVSGEYMKTPQILADNTDEPECPSRYHHAISDLANILMAQHDEAELHIITNQQRYDSVMADMRLSELPTLGIGARPLA